MTVGACGSSPALPSATEPSSGGPGAEIEIERVIDGDSLEAVVDGVEIEIRLAGINAPELYTVGDAPSCPGAAARDHLDRLLGQGPLAWRAAGEDRFGRALGEIEVDGRPVTEAMVEAGMALALWSADDPGSIEAMRGAASRAVGLWGDGCGRPAASGLTIGDHQVDAPGDDRQNPADEWVTVVNDGSDPVDLDGWTIRDETTSNRFGLDDLALEPGDTVRFRSGSGRRTDGDYFLDQAYPVWSNRGETVLLLDPDGIVAAYAFIDG